MLTSLCTDENFWETADTGVIFVLATSTSHCRAPKHSLLLGYVVFAVFTLGRLAKTMEGNRKLHGCH